VTATVILLPVDTINDDIVSLDVDHYRRYTAPLHLVITRREIIREMIKAKILMKSEVISSTQNPIVKRIRSIKTRKGRTRERAFWVEGLAPVMEAIDAGWEVQTIVRAPDLLRSEEAIRFLAPVDVEERHLSSDVFERISDRDGPTGLGAIVSTRDLGLGALEVTAETLVTILVEPQDPGNVGTIIRTSYCAGASAVVLVGPSTDPFDPRSVRASMGSLFRIPVVRERMIPGLVEWASDAGLGLVGTSARGKSSYRTADYTLPLGIVLGNEQKGIPEELADACGSLVSIPILGTIRSLNLSAAAAVILYEAAHQVGLHKR
jgi:TrmH family RNA methyltransferase